MNKDYCDFIDILKLHINNKSFDGDCNWQSIYSLSNIHNLTGMVYSTVAANKNIPSDILTLMKKKFISISALGIMQERVVDSITEAFNKISCDHILIKGSVVRNYYPYPELRTMGDIDILVKSSKGIEETMAELGYERTGGSEGEMVFKKNNSVVEIHTALRGMNFKDNVDFDQYFSNIFNNGVCIKGCHTYELDCSSHIIFMIVHMAKHFHNEGCGIRMFLDLAVTLKRFKNSVDMDKILRELSKLHLYRFACNIFKMCSEFFDIDCMADYEINSELKESICSYILKGGTFGFENNVHSDVVLRNMKNSKNKINKASLIVKWIFPDINTMRYKVNWFKNAPGFLLPAAWIYRAVSLVFNKNKVKNLFNGNKRIKNALNTVDGLGLYDN